MSPWLILTGALSLGLITSLHCVGMCGGIILAVGGAFEPGEKVSWRKGWGVHIVYHLGRFITVVSLGAAAGAAGTLIRRIGAAAGFHHAAMAVSIVILVIVALEIMGVIKVPGGSGSEGRVSAWLSRLLHAVSGTPGAFVMGLLTGFLPCAPLYGALALAMAAGSPALGALSMAGFWAGTVPLLLVFGHSGRMLVTRLRGRVSVAIGVLIIAVAVTLTALKIASAMNPAPMLDPGRAPAMHHP